MDIKKVNTNKIIISICISIILILACFYRYEIKIKEDYIEKAKKDAIYASETNSKLFQTKIIGVIQSLNLIKDSYFNHLNEITPEIKENVLETINKYKDKFLIYTYDEFKKFVEENGATLDVIKNNPVVIHLDETKEIITEIGVVSPILNNGKVIGGISGIVFQDEFKEIFAKENHKFSTYIFGRSGRVLLGKQDLKGNNVFDYFSEKEIVEGYTIDDIKKKIEQGEPFNIFFKDKDKKHFAFFRPAKGDICVLEIMDENYFNKNVKSTSKFLINILSQVILIISLEIFYLFGVINNQNKNLYKIESKKRAEIKGIINSVPGGVIQILCNEDLEINFANDGFYNLTGYSKDEYIRKFNNSHSKIVFKEDLKNILIELKNKIKNKENINLQYRIIKKNNEICWISLTGVYLENKDDLEIYQCIAIDNTSYKAILNELEIEKEQYKIISEISDEIIFEYDLKLDTIYLSDKYRTKFDIDLITTPFIKSTLKNKILHKEDLKIFLNSMKAIRNAETLLGNEVRVKTNSGEYKWIFYQCIPLKNNNGDIYKVVGKISNIDKIKKEIEELREKSNKDPLTKFYNKGAIENMVNKFILNPEGRQMGLFIIDIDNFKSINDTFGHIFGDAVLKEVTNDIRKVFYEDELIGRIGGDEFVVFLPNIKDYKYIYQKADKICKLLRKTYVNEGKVYKISASIGIADFSKEFKTYSELLEKADIALYNAKKYGKDRYKMYNKNMKDINLLEIYKSKNKDIEHKEYNYRNIFISISEMFLETKDFRNGIGIILATLCKNFGVERGYVFESIDNGYICNTHEWCEYGIEPFIDKNKKVKFNSEEYLKIYENNPFLYFPKIEEINLEENKFYKYLVQKEDIKSFFSCYIMDEGKVKGYIGFESYTKPFNLKKDEIDCAVLISKIIGGKILKDKTEQNLFLGDQLNKAIVSSQQLYTYIIDKNTYEVLYYNDKLKDLIPNIKTGGICYKAKGYSTHCHECPIKNMNQSETGTTKFYCKTMDNWVGATSKKIQWLDKKEAYIICYQDISQYIEQINYVDSLTGAPNINKFKVCVKSILNNIHISDSNYLIAYIDIDKFKYINNTFGYERGNEILKSFVLFLENTLEKNETFCRISEDRFLMLLRNEKEAEVYSRINQIYSKIDKMYKEIFKEVRIIFICGISYLSEYNDLDETIDRANIARKSIKGSHKNSFAIYTEEMKEQAAKEKMIEYKMRYALENDEFTAYLQPKFDLETKRVCGAEALVRWKQADGTMIFPNDFIPIFEKNGFIIELDFYIYEKMIRKIRQWIDLGLEPIPISLNISRVQINNIEFANKIIYLVEKYNVSPHFIEFELTESVFSKDVKSLKETMKELKQKGFKLSIDDFGSEYSSLNLLKELDVDIVKLDKGFLYNKGTGEKNNILKKEKIIVEYIVKMAKELNLQVICEGVEMDSQVEFLKNIGCEMGQGYVFSKPISIEEFEQKYLEKIIKG